MDEQINEQVPTEQPQKQSILLVPKKKFPRWAKVLISIFVIFILPSVAFQMMGGVNRVGPENPRLQETGADLMKFLKKDFADGRVVFSEFKAGNETSKSREVPVRDKTKILIFNDALDSLYLSNNDNIPFMRFVIDKSKPENYDSDKSILIEYLKNADGKTQHYEMATYRGQEYHQGYSEGQGNIGGVTMIFDDNAKLTLTIYFRNRESDDYILSMKPEDVGLRRAVVEGIIDIILSTRN